MQEVIRLVPPRSLTLAALEAAWRDLEVRLNNLAQQHARLAGRDGATPTFQNHVDLGGNRLKNVGPTIDQSDAPNRKELQTHALYVKNGAHVADRPIHARGGLRTGVPAVSGDDVVPLRQLKDAIASAAGSGTVSSITAGTGLTATPDPIVATGSLAITDTITAGGPIGDGTHVAQITYNAQGQLTTVASVAITAPGVSSISAGTGITLTPNPIVGTGSIALSDAIVAGGPTGDATHVAQVTYNAKGQLTTVASVAITGVPPGGTAGGDLSGTYPNPAVVQKFTRTFLLMGA